MSCNACLQKESHVTIDGRSVSQCVLVSSPFWFSWPDVCDCLMVTVMSWRDALSEERPGLSSASQSLQYLVVCQYVFPFQVFKHIMSCIYSKTCSNYNRKGPNIFSILAKFPHYTK
jgi:hypothetical protein